MADGNGTPKLKRKREGTEPQRKKAKKHASSQHRNAKAETENSLKTSPKALGTSTTQSSTKTKAEPTPLCKIEPEPTPTPTPTSPQSLHSEAPISRSNSKKEVKAEKDETMAVRETRTQTSPFPGREDDEAAMTHTRDSNHSSKQEKKRKKYKSKVSDSWNLSGPQGGWFLQHDTVFSPDEKHVLLAKPKTLEVYATETSLLVRELHTGKAAVILSFTLSPVHTRHVYIADSAGIISLWDWTTGSKISRWDIGANAHHITAVQQPDADQDLLFTHEIGKRHVINVHVLKRGAHASQTELKQIIKTKRPIAGIQVFHQGRIVVVMSKDSILIGKRTKLHKTNVQDFEYIWREFDMSQPLTSFSAYLRDSSKSQQNSRDFLDLAVGDSEGVIYLFEDILSTLAKIEQSQRNKTGEVMGPQDLRPKRLHWHRNAVASVQWSRDGNYLISGGKETVMSIWQLATGKQQFLPHLTAAIENVVVSPSGASYALLLANNSVVILSTSELRARTNIVGVQSRRIDSEQLPLDLSTGSHLIQSYSTVPMTVDPRNRGQVMFTAPSSQPHNEAAGRYSEPYAQTYDILAHRPLLRQALTRNNATDPNIDPEGKPVCEPHVRFVQISHDGEWLASVDEWLPPRPAMAHIEEGDRLSNDEERLFRREVYLKLWRRSENGSQWVLDARIDAPHTLEGVSAHARVLDLIADPSAVGFATVGEDLAVRVWRPKIRTRDGLIIRGADKKGLVTWSLSQSIGIPNRSDIEESEQSPRDAPKPHSCRLAFSTDGSVLAAGVCWSSHREPGVIHLLNTKKSEISRSITEVNVTTLAGLGIVGRYLVVVARSITIWDIVLDQLVHSIPIETPGVDLALRSQLIRLAFHQADGSFALSTPRFEKQKHAGAKRYMWASSTIKIFRPEQLKPLSSHTIPEIVLALASMEDGGGYVALDASANIRTISPKVTAHQLLTPPPEDMVPTSIGMDNLVVKDEHEASLQLPASEELLRDFGNDKPVVSTEQLQNVFDRGSSQMLPPIRELFDAVVRLYARKPRNTGTV